ncbi:MAG TPA: UDP-N-acetylmuramoyl-L-alanyl-D-glutamate--2,6-diaminopimelate ligase [Deltaproteobacteria bacterium]|nr:UDP-N-acetylmuramoyl-L-alanyl-D-glutamate--2,6-diaminopimelate ligase [Deltaproteobacteria bacterium]
MRTSELLTLIPGSKATGREREFVSLRSDSSKVQPGDAFIALLGSMTDGHLFIQDAVRAGAEAIVCNHGRHNKASGATIVEVPDTRDALKTLLPLLYPCANNISLSGITGTNGKTTSAYLIESVFKASGTNPGVIGTINMRYADQAISSSITTPGPIDLFRALDAMNRSGVDSCIMEVSSHALDQDRTAGLMFDYAIFTNLTQDHLDYHKDMDTYFLAKKKLFTHYLKGKAIINIDDPYGKRLAQEISDPVTYGWDHAAMIQATSLEHIPDGLLVSLSTPRGGFTLKSSLLGDINTYNIMAAVALSHAMGIEMHSVITGIDNMRKVPGRMEPVDNAYNLRIIVDYAHTPAALQAALESARGLAKGRLITLFGCGGDRDRGKRPIMGKIASAISDIVIITSDNPRKENPLAIIEGIVKGIPAGSRIFVEPDRKKAIALALSTMNIDDCLIIAGKGHEDYQIIGETKTSFDDRLIVQQSLMEIYNK